MDREPHKYRPDEFQDQEQYFFQPVVRSKNQFQSDQFGCFIYTPNTEEFIIQQAAPESGLQHQINTIKDGGWAFWCDQIVGKQASSVYERIERFFNVEDPISSLKLEYTINSGGRTRHLLHEMFNYRFQLVRYVICFFAWGPISKYRSRNCSMAKPDRYSISKREKEVLDLIADGYSSKEIADRLFISNHTVISHRKNLIEKFEAKNTANLVKIASSIIALG